MSWFMDLVLFLQRNSIVPVFAVFLVLLVWTYWPSRKAQVESQGRIPLDDDPEKGPSDAD